MTRPASADGDPDGEHRLNVDLGAESDSAPGPMFHHLVARTTFFDEITVAAIDAGVRQIVVVDATLALSLARRDRVVADPAAAARRAVLHHRLRRIGEPPRTTLGRAEWEARLASTGWAIDRAVDPNTIDPEATAGGALLVTAKPAGSEE
jgi:O-methyltransferase involved in polyketide biosynthesis